MNEPTTDDAKGFRQDRYIKTGRLTRNVVEVQIDHLFKSRLILATYLPKAGESGEGGKAAHVAGLVLAELVWEAGPRADPGHLATQHVHELRQFIESRPPQKFATTDHSLVAPGIQFGHGIAGFDHGFEIGLVRRRVRIDVHGSELEALEGPSLVSDASLAEDNRAGRSDLHIRGDQQHEGQQQGQQGDYQQRVEDPLPYRNPNGGYIGCRHSGRRAGTLRCPVFKFAMRLASRFTGSRARLSTGRTHQNTGLALHVDSLFSGQTPFGSPQPGTRHTVISADSQFLSELTIDVNKYLLIDD